MSSTDIEKIRQVVREELLRVGALPDKKEPMTQEEIKWAREALRKAGVGGFRTPL